MAKAKSVWKKEIPEKTGWYWIKYRGKHGVTKCPCSVHWLKRFPGQEWDCVVHTARNDAFTNKTQKIGFSSARFGPEIEIPK